MQRGDYTFEGPDGPFHYIDWGGNGPMAHFAHATGLCAGTYTPLAERLQPHLRILGMDDRGHGETKAPADPQALNNWDIFVDDLERFVEHLAEPVIAMGHSRGATVSLLLAAKRFKASVAGAVFRCFGETGHFVPMERPSETVEAILDFIENEFKAPS